MRKFSRLEAIRRMGMFAAGPAILQGCAGARARVPARRDSRPNILFILTDDQRWDAMSCMDHPFLETPHMDRLAREGVRFDNAFVAISLCSPSRACFLTGTYPHINGVRVNSKTDPDPEIPIFPALLKDAGYDTAFIGKWHMKPDPSPRPGFDYWLSFLGQGVYINPELNESGHDFKATGYMTDLLTDYAATWLKRPRQTPFCLILSHKAVHGPFTPARRHRKLFTDVQMPKPVSFDDTYEGKPKWQRAAFVRGLTRDAIEQNKDKPVPKSLPPGTWKGHQSHMINYYRALVAVDESIGRVLDTLERLGELDSTVIIFAGDNGYFHGEHRLGDKRLMYEEALRIPLLVRYPKMVRPRSVCREMILNIDIAPTVLDLAEVTIPDTMQGESLRPLLAGQQTAWRKSFLYEYFEEDWLPGIPSMLGVRTEQWKYVQYPDIQDLDELYQLEMDPHEMHNLAQDPSFNAKLVEMKEELGRLLKKTGYR